MSASKDEILRDQAERDGLSKAIADAETALAGSAPGTRRLIENFVEHAKTRVVLLDKKIEEAKVECVAEVQAQLVAAALAAKETKLNATERETYRGFLEKDFFTKKDFGKLNAFYTHSYDILSEGGKEEMSKRIHEGIKRGEFKFTDLPQAIQQRDNAHCMAKANKEASAQVEVNKSKDNSDRSTKPTEKLAAKDIDLGSIDLSGIKLADAAVRPSVSTLPDASGSKVTQR